MNLLGRNIYGDVNCVRGVAVRSCVLDNNAHREEFFTVYQPIYRVSSVLWRGFRRKSIFCRRRRNSTDGSGGGFRARVRRHQRGRRLAECRKPRT